LSALALGKSDTESTTSVAGAGKVTTSRASASVPLLRSCALCCAHAPPPAALRLHSAYVVRRSALARATLTGSGPTWGLRMNRAKE
jgi:hypothetical protein